MVYNNLIYRVIDTGEIVIDSITNRNIKHIIIPDEIDDIPVVLIVNDAFRDCPKLETVVISDNVNCIGRRAFQNDKKLKSVKLSKNIRKICSDTFNGCTSLEDIVLGDMLSTIESRAFYKCRNLKNISLPHNLTHIGEQAFYQCENITKIIIPINIREIYEYTFFGCSSLERVDLPLFLNTIGPYAFSDCSELQEITIPHNVKKIEGSFKWCTSLKKIRFECVGTMIDSQTFFGCTNLKEISLEENLDTVALNAFERCHVSKITFSRHVCFFSNITEACKNQLKEVCVAKDNPFFTSENGVLFDKEKEELLLYPAAKKGKKYVIPITVNKIYEKAFEDCNELEEIIYPHEIIYCHY